MLTSLSTHLTAAPVKVAILGLVDWNVPVAVIVPQEYEALAPEPGASAKPPAGSGPVTAGTSATLVAVTTRTEVAPAAPFVAGVGVAVMNETRGTVTAAVMIVTVEAEEMVCVYEIVVTGPETLTIIGGAGMMDVMTLPDRVMVT